MNLATADVGWNMVIGAANFTLPSEAEVYERARRIAQEFWGSWIMTDKVPDAEVPSVIERLLKFADFGYDVSTNNRPQNSFPPAQGEYTIGFLAPKILVENADVELTNWLVDKRRIVSKVGYVMAKQEGKILMYPGRIDSIENKVASFENIPYAGKKAHDRIYHVSIILMLHEYDLMHSEMINPEQCR